MMLSYIILGKCDISKETKTKKTVQEDTDTVGRMQFEEWLNEGPRILEKKKKNENGIVTPLHLKLL